MEYLIDKIPKPKVGHIKLLSVDKIMVPHPYCITPKHLTGESMYLTKEIIRDAEKKYGAVCDICRHLVKQGKQKVVLNFDEHQDGLTLFIEVPKGDLNEVEGLKKYLLEIKPVLRDLGIEGVAFKQV
jgi:hypothetical protein